MSALAASRAPMLERALALDQPGATDATTERILDATFEQFLLVGLRRTTIDDVARRAGVGRVTIYRRVGQKHELVEAVILREVGRVVAEVSTAIAMLPDPQQRVVEAFVIGLRAMRGHPLLRRLLETEPEDLLPYLTLDAGASLAIGRGFIADQIRDAARGKGWRGPDPELIGEILTRLAQSLVLTPDGAIPLDDERRLRSFAHAYLAPLVSAASAPRTRR
jgi:AcrR family transcriptional regulator